MVSPSRAVVVNASVSSVEDGTADSQTSQNFSTSTFNQQYALAMDGLDLTPELLSRIGTLQFNGAGKITLNEVANSSVSGAGATSPGLIAGGNSERWDAEPFGHVRSFPLAGLRAAG
jgi:hypothetical protein